MQKYFSNNVAHAQSLALMAALTVCALFPTDALAGVSSPMGSVLCGVIEIVYGNFGRALATIAIISIGMGAMLGKVSWGLGLTVISGIAIIFGSAFLAKGFLNTMGAGATIGCIATGG